MALGHYNNVGREAHILPLNSTQPTNLLAHGEITAYECGDIGLKLVLLLSSCVNLASGCKTLGNFQKYHMHVNAILCKTALKFFDASLVMWHKSIDIVSDLNRKFLS